MTSITKLDEIKHLIEKKISLSLKSLIFEPKLSRLSIFLQDGTIIYIRYNDFQENSYNLIFSKNNLDTCRFDNYDDRWDVKTHPNHVHPRFNKYGCSSPMMGEPEQDIPLLCYLLKADKLLNKDIQF